VRFGSDQPQEPFGAPAFGQHSNELLSAHGYSDAEIETLRARGVIL
jgi:crotonobetainyl-CoA:carnitine CoA-transferase CaiB-like acyl-CoA transferase